jgi:hypothetical protein
MSCGATSTWIRTREPLNRPPGATATGAAASAQSSKVDRFADAIEAWRSRANAPDTGIEFRAVDVTAFEVASTRPPF